MHIESTNEVPFMVPGKRQEKSLFFTFISESLSLVYSVLFYSNILFKTELEKAIIVLGKR